MTETTFNRGAIDDISQPVEPLSSREIRPVWLTYREAETLTGLSRVTLWKLISAKHVKAAKVGRAVRISRRSLEAYMEERAANV